MTQADPFGQPAQTAPAQAQFSDDEFGTAPRREGKMPRMSELFGRTLLITPHSIEMVPDDLNPGKMKERLTADVVVLDGPFPIIRLNGKTGQPTGEPALEDREYERMWINAKAIVDASRGTIARKPGYPKRLLGRVSKGKASQKGWNDPYILAPMTDQDAALARAWLATHASPDFG